LRIELARRDETLEAIMQYSGELAGADSIAEELELCLQGAGQLAQGLEPAENSPQARTMIIHFPLPA